MAFFLAVRVRFHKLLFFDEAHCLSSHASSASRVGYASVSLASPASHLASRASRHATHALSSFSVHSASSSALHSGKVSAFGFVSPLIFMISITKTRHAFAGILGGLPAAP